MDETLKGAQISARNHIQMNELRTTSRNTNTQTCRKAQRLENKEQKSSHAEGQSNQLINTQTLQQIDKHTIRRTYVNRKPDKQTENKEIQL